jgi:hypothetical protein
MSSQNDVGFKTFQASGAISGFLAVDLNSDGTISPAAGPGPGIGVLMENVPTPGTGQSACYGNVKLWSAPGTTMVLVSGTRVTPGLVYTVTAGYVDAATAAAAGFIRCIAGGANSPGIILEFVQI